MVKYESPKAEIIKFDVIEDTTMMKPSTVINNTNEGNLPGGNNDGSFDSEVW